MSDREPEVQESQEAGQAPSGERSRPATGRALRETLVTVVVALVLALLVRQFVVESFVVDGPSMMPNLLNGDHLLVNKFIYDFQSPQIGQVIVFMPPPAADATTDYIKRIIAVGGDTVAMQDGQVYVDGRLQQEPYLPPAYQDTYNMPPEVVPQGDVFVLGDHRAVSKDSRYFGFVPIRNIRGQAFLIWWPPQVAGAVP